MSTALLRAKVLAQTRDWRNLAALENELSAEEINGCPDLAYLLADALRRTGNPERAEPLAQASESGALRSADDRLLLRATNLLGMIAFETGDLEQASQLFSELLTRATEGGNDEFAARASNNLGILANVRGHPELALTYYQRALAAYHRIGYSRGLAQTHYNLGISYRDLGYFPEADVHYERAIVFAEESSSQDVVALAETERALARAREGDGELAESLATRALALQEQLGDPSGAANAVRALAGAATARHQLRLALERLDSALENILSHPDALVRAEIQRDRAILLERIGSPAAALSAIQEAIALFRDVGASGEIASSSVVLNRLHRAATEL